MIGASATAASAGGLFLPGSGIIAQSRGGAYVANASDPTALSVNPAGLAKTSGTVLLIGASFVDYAMSFQRSGTYDMVDNVDRDWEGQPYPLIEDSSKPAIGIGAFQALPNIVVATDLGGKVKGLTLAFGLVPPSAYPNREYDGDYQIDDETRPPPPTRYDTVKQEAAVVLPSIAAAYRINPKIDVGVRLSWGIGEVKAKTFVWGQRNFEEDIAQEAVFTVEAKDTFVPAAGLGVLYRPTNMIEIGASWDSQVNVHAKGTGTSIASAGLEIIPDMPVVITPPNDSMAKCAPGGVEGALKACVNIGLPMITTVGGRYIFRDASGVEQGDIEADVAWERWKAVSDHYVVVDGVALGTLPLHPTFIRHGAKDVFSLRLGGSYRIPVGAAAIQMRAGAAYDTAAVKDGWERVDFDGAARTTMTVGGSYQMKKFDIHAGFGFVHEGSRDVGTDCNPTTDNPGCGPDGEQLQADRDGPDPALPLTEGTGFESPFNAGTYTSHYVLFSLGVTARF